MRRLVTGLGLARSSARIVRRTPVLLIPGLVQTAALLAVLALVLRYGVSVDPSGGVDLSPGSLAVLAGALFATTVVGVWAGAVVVAVTADRLAGGQAGLRDGVRVANRNLPALLVWALISATVGTVLRALEERLGPPGRWISGGLGVLFAVSTVLVIPVLVLEGARPLPALRRSAQLFRGRFGETASGQAGLSAAMFVVLLAALVVIVCPLLAVDLLAGLAALAVVVVGWLTATSVLQAVFSAALHRVATGLPAGGPFGDLTELFPPTPQRYVPSYAAPHSGWDAS